jgi:hypothetical protein
MSKTSCADVGRKVSHVVTTIKSLGIGKQLQSDSGQFVSLSGESAWICMSSVKGGLLLRWQILKAAHKERGYLGPVSNREIARDAERARSAWLEWLQTENINLLWFQLKLDLLTRKDKFTYIRRMFASLASSEGGSQGKGLPRSCFQSGNRS